MLATRGVALPRLLDRLQSVANGVLDSTVPARVSNLVNNINNVTDMVRRYRRSRSGAPPATRARIMPAVVVPSTAVAPRRRRPLRSLYSRRRRSYGGRRPFRRVGRRFRRSYGRFNRRGSFAKGNIYRRRVKSVRPFNRGPFRIGQFLADGAVFPKQTFVRMKYRGMKEMSFADLPGARIPRILDLASVYEHATGFNDPTNRASNWQYANVFNKFYREYLVLGARTRITITKPANPRFLGMGQYGLSAGTVSNYYFATNSVGYWYCRLFYVKDGESVGDPIERTGLPAEKTRWKTLREFLLDPTVMFVKDSAMKSTKMGYMYTPTQALAPNGILPGVLSGGTPVGSAPSFYYEVESSQNTVSFTIRFSAKKHYGDKNILKNGEYRGWNESTAVTSSSFFRVLFGYVGFGDDNQPNTETPMDGHFTRNVTIDTSAYLCLQGPLIDPSDVVTGSTARQAMEEDPDGVEALNYAINRNSEDSATPELEKELFQEVDNLLEQESDVEDEEAETDCPLDSGSEEE